MSDFKAECREEPGDFLRIDKLWEKDSVDLGVTEGSTFSAVSLTSEDLYRLVDWIEKNFDRPPPFERGDIVRCPSGCLAIVKGVRDGVALVHTSAVEATLTFDELTLVHRDERPGKPG